MSIEIIVDGARLENLSDGARQTLKKQVNEYTDEVLKEARLIEEGIREDGASREITSNIILNAVRKHRNYLVKKPSKWVIIIKTTSSLSLLLTGFLFDSNGYQDNIPKLISFIIFLIIACVSTVIQYVKE